MPPPIWREGWLLVPDLLTHSDVELLREQLGSIEAGGPAPNPRRQPQHHAPPPDPHPGTTDTWRLPPRRPPLGLPCHRPLRLSGNQHAVDPARVRAHLLGDGGHS